MNQKQWMVLVGVFSMLVMLGGILAVLFGKDCCGIRSKCLCGCKGD